MNANIHTFWRALSKIPAVAYNFVITDSVNKNLKKLKKKYNKKKQIKKKKSQLTHSMSGIIAQVCAYCIWH